MLTLVGAASGPGARGGDGMPAERGRVLSAVGDPPLPAEHWVLEDSSKAAQGCSAGRRGAAEKECLAAVRVAASTNGLVVAGFKSVNDGAAGFVPAGCSFSLHTKTAMFNANADGGLRVGSYRLACLASPDEVPSSAAPTAAPKSDGSLGDSARLDAPPEPLLAIIVSTQRSASTDAAEAIGSHPCGASFNELLFDAKVPSGYEKYVRSRGIDAYLNLTGNTLRRSHWLEDALQARELLCEQRPSEIKARCGERCVVALKMHLNQFLTEDRDPYSIELLTDARVAVVVLERGGTDNYCSIEAAQNTDYWGHNPGQHASSQGGQVLAAKAKAECLAAQDIKTPRTVKYPVAALEPGGNGETNAQHWAAVVSRRFAIVRDELRRARRPWLELPFTTYVADAAEASGRILDHVGLGRREAGWGDTCWVPWCKHSVLPESEPETLRSRHALGPRPLSETECMAQLDMLPDAVVALSEGLIWCPTAKAGTTSILALLNRKFNSPAVGFRRSVAADNYAGWRLTGNAAQECVQADSMDQLAKHRFCAKGNALSFSVMRSPWERVLSCYLEKVAATQKVEAWSSGDHPGGLVEIIIHDLDLVASETISFSQFVRWLAGKQPGKDDNIHIMPWCAPCLTLRAPAPPPRMMWRTAGSMEPRPDDPTTTRCCEQVGAMWRSRAVQLFHDRPDWDARGARHPCHPCPRLARPSSTSPHLTRLLSKQDDLRSLLDTLHWDQVRPLRVRNTFWPAR